MVPPAKRRRKNVIPSSSPTSEDEDREHQPTTKLKAPLVDLISSSPPQSNAPNSIPLRAASQKPAKAPIKLQPRVKTANHPHNAAPIYLPTSSRAKAGSKSASNSPEKPKKKAKVDEKGKSGDIFTFFTKQAQRQQAEGSSGALGKKSKVAVPPSSAGLMEDEDIISDDDAVGPSSTQSNSVVGFAARKRARATDGFALGNGDLPSASQRFKRALRPVVESKPVEDTRPWAERFGPVNLDELAVHKRKVSDVRTWLENVTTGRLRQQRLLILKGGAGTGKTTTIQLLAEAMNCDVLEWHNPVGSVASSDGYLSMAAQFEEFMGRGGKFGQLDIFSEGPVPSKPDDRPLDRRKNIILIEEFPSTFTRSSMALQSFRSAILQYLAANVPHYSLMPNPNETVTPVVMIISETLLTTTSASADSFTAHRLLGAEILQHPGVGVIEFNAIAPTILAKALETVVQKESRKSGRKKTPGPMVLKKLGEIGDIRSAIAALEFLCLRGDTDGDWGAKVAFGKSKKMAKDTALTKMEEESLELVTRREASLGIFHAVGKVVWNKRDEKPPSLPADQDVEKLPNFMSLHCRPNRSQVVVNDLIDETGTDTQTFISALHENYILSCDAPPSSYDFTTLDHVNGCMDALSDSDLLCPAWDGSVNSSGFGGGSRGGSGDVIRQDEIAFHIAVRGILFSLPYPVVRKESEGGKRGDLFKMFYPMSLKLWRTREEIESAIDLWVEKLMKGGGLGEQGVVNGAAMFARGKGGTVESWKNNTHSSTQDPSSNGEKGKSDSATAGPLLSVGTSARKEMLLERLPYMLQIAKSRRQTNSVVSIKEMEKVVCFRGIGGPSEESEEEDGDGVASGEEWATDKATEGGGIKGKRGSKGLVFRGRDKGSGSMVPMQIEEKLWLSDDDIEDD